MTRITINGQEYGTGENVGSLTIDRICPGVLCRAMSEHEWTSFCDKIDETLAPAGPLKQKIRSYGRCDIIIVFANVAMFAVPSFLPVNIPDFYYPLAGSISFLTFVWAGCMRYRPAKKLQKIKKKVEQVCEEESRRKSNVSFHFRVSERCFKEII